MKKKLIFYIAAIAALTLSFFNVENSEITEPALVVSEDDLAEIVKQVNRLNIDDFGYKRLMLFMSKRPAIEEMLVESIIMRRKLFDIVAGSKNYEVIISYKKRPAMIVYLDYKNDKLHSVNYASIIDYDSIDLINK